MDPIFTIGAAEWNTVVTSGQQADAVQALERGQVLCFPNLALPMSNQERRFLTPQVLHESKNVSYDPVAGTVSGTSCVAGEKSELANLIGGFSVKATALLNNLLPVYRFGLRRGRASLRPVEVANRTQSWRKDDTRLHVDSFPSQPTKGKRLLRLFTNVNPAGKPRRWRVGEPFAAVARRFWSRLRAPLPGSNLLLRMFHVTKSTRTDYDHYMLQLHDAMKADQDYQMRAKQVVHDFPAGSTWVCYTDQVSHAALAGQHQFEQTFRLPVMGMHNAELSPLRVLEGLANRRLA